MEPGSGSEKGQLYDEDCAPFALSKHVTLVKVAWEATKRKLCLKQSGSHGEGITLQHRDNKEYILNFIQNLHSDKKQKVWHPTCTKHEQGEEDEKHRHFTSYLELGGDSSKKSWFCFFIGFLVVTIWAIGLQWVASDKFFFKNMFADWPCVGQAYITFPIQKKKKIYIYTYIYLHTWSIIYKHTWYRWHIIYNIYVYVNAQISLPSHFGLSDVTLCYVCVIAVHDRLFMEWSLESLHRRFGMATGSSLLPVLGYEDTQECTGYFKLWAHTVMVLERSKGRGATVQRQLQWPTSLSRPTDAGLDRLGIKVAEGTRKGYEPGRDINHSLHRARNKQKSCSHDSWIAQMWCKSHMRLAYNAIGIRNFFEASIVRKVWAYQWVNLKGL